MIRFINLLPRAYIVEKRVIRALVGQEREQTRWTNSETRDVAQKPRQLSRYVLSWL